MTTKKSNLNSFIAGAFAGCVDTCITMPLDTVKTKLQINPKAGLFNCAREIVKADGVRGLYYGFQPFVIQASGKAAVRFYAYGLFASMLTNLGFAREKNPTIFSTICGTAAGTCEAVFWTCPTERMKVLRQSVAGTGVNGGTISIQSVIQTQGILGLYRGVVPTVLRQASSVAIRFTLFERIRDGLNVLFNVKEGVTSTSTIATISFLSGGIGGAVSVIVNNPVDVIKSKVQSISKKELNPGTWEMAKQVFHENGLRGFAAGLSARIPRLFLSQAIQFTIVDQILRNLSKT